MIKRTDKAYIKKLLSEQKGTWKILDMACGAKSEWGSAGFFVDNQDYSHHYFNQTFVQSNLYRTPFADKEFDFVIASNIIASLRKPGEFLKEVQRIGKKGYIEAPKAFCDNLLLGETPKRWWIDFDDIEMKLTLQARLEVLKSSINAQELGMLMPFFKSSLITELYWENEIPWKMQESIFYFRNEVLDYSKTGFDVHSWYLGEISIMDLEEEHSKS